MDIYAWVEKGRHYFALNGSGEELDEFFMDVVDNDIDINNQEESEQWFRFWSPPDHADVICNLYPVQYQKPHTDIEQAQYERALESSEHQKMLDKQAAENWGNVKPLSAEQIAKIKETEKNLDIVLKTSKPSDVVLSYNESIESKE